MDYGTTVYEVGDWWTERHFWVAFLNTQVVPILQWQVPSEWQQAPNTCIVILLIVRSAAFSSVLCVLLAYTSRFLLSFSDLSLVCLPFLSGLVFPTFPDDYLLLNPFPSDSRHDATTNSSDLRVRHHFAAG